MTSTMITGSSHHIILNKITASIRAITIYKISLSSIILNYNLIYLYISVNNNVNHQKKD